MIFLLISFIAGVLTVLAPCILPLLPVIIGGSLSSGRKSRPYIVVISLSVSIILFTFILKVSTIFISIPPQVWQWISGTIVIIFGLILLFPDFYDKWLSKFNLAIGRKGNQLLAEGVKKESVSGDILIGAALGPVFSTCSPTYFIILATVLPQGFFMGFISLIAYTLGLSIMLFLIARLGQRIVSKLTNVSNPHGAFKKTLGVLFILVGVFVISGFDKKIQTAIVQNEIFDITRLEQKILDKTFNEDSTLEPYREINNPAGFVNSESFLLKDFIGKKVILLDFMTYSCINCQRTFPYLVKWHEAYADQGLMIVGIHTPEFAFEKKKENVEAAMKQFGIKFPIVLDNDYGTWNAYGNNVWPRKYLIDINGNIVFDHKGEGAYLEIEEKIKELLKERGEKFGIETKMNSNVASTINEKQNFARSPETYFGALRNEFLANGTRGAIGTQMFTFGSGAQKFQNRLYLGGSWDIEAEFAKAVQNASVLYRYNASKIFIVASSEKGGSIKVYKNGKFVSEINVKDAKLYTLIDGAPESAELRLEVTPGVELYAFTFG